MSINSPHDLKQKLLNPDKIGSINGDDNTNYIINTNTHQESIANNCNQISYTLLFKLCLLGFFFNFQPSESYLSSYLEDIKHFTSSDIDNNIWPYDTYGSLLSLIPIGLFAEHFGFRSVIFFGLICRELTRILLIFGNKLYQMSLMQITYSCAISINWIYYAYIYMVFIFSNQYQIATSYVQSSMLLGTFLSSILAQIIVSYTSLANNYLSLFYISWIFTSLALLSFAILPKPKRNSPISAFKIIRENGVIVLYKYICAMYSESSNIVLLWSIWWCGAYASYSIYSNYYQTQFTDYNHNKNDIYGAINAVMELSGIIGSLIPVFYSFIYNKNNNNQHKLWINYSYSIILISSIIITLSLLITVIFKYLYISYIFNSIILGIYHFQLAVACSCIAGAINNNNNNNNNNNYYAIIFTTNSFCGLLLATISQLIGSVMEWTTSIYYLTCVLLHIATIIALLLLKCCRN